MRSGLETIFKRLFGVMLVTLWMTLCISGCGANNQTEDTDSVLPGEEEMKEPDKLIICWGDSVTEGMSYSAEQAYPGQLMSFLGEGYDVKNSGDGGETSSTIMARMGIVKMYTSNEVVFAEGETEVQIGTASSTGLQTEEGENIMPTSAMGRDVSCQQITIDGEVYQLELREFKWNTGGSPIQYDSYLVRTNTEEVTIAKGTEAVFDSVKMTQEAYCNIIFMGANDALKDSDTLLLQYKKLVESLGEDSKYIIIIPYWGGYSEWNAEDDAKFTDAFGDHVINFRQKAIESGAEYTDLPLRDRDINDMQLGYIPSVLCHQYVNNVHLNEYGYKFLAYCIHQQGIELGYWSENMQGGE